MKHSRSVTPCDPLVTPFADQRSHELGEQYQWLTDSVTPVTPITDEKTLGSLAAMLLGSTPHTWAAGVYIGNWGHRGYRGHKWTVTNPLKMGWAAFRQGTPQGHPRAGFVDPLKTPSSKILQYVRLQDGF